MIEYRDNIGEEVHLQVGNHNSESVNTFTYLGVVVSGHSIGDLEIQNINIQHTNIKF